MRKTEILKGIYPQPESLSPINRFSWKFVASFLSHKWTKFSPVLPKKMKKKKNISYVNGCHFTTYLDM